MVEYRKKATTKNGIEELPIPDDNATSDVGEVWEAYMELAVQYELYDMIIGDLGNNPQQPVEEEYRAYVTTPLSKLPSLKFWEVHGNINGVNLLRRHGSSTGQSFQCYLLWQWTTCPSRLRLFLANRSSHQALKLTPSGGIIWVPLQWRLFKC